jgi:hypothetical protein
MPETFVPRPNVINRLRFAADSAFAMMAGMQLDLFTPLKDGPMTAQEIARAARPSRESSVCFRRETIIQALP